MPPFTPPAQPQQCRSAGGVCVTCVATLLSLATYSGAAGEVGCHNECAGSLSMLRTYFAACRPWGQPPRNKDQAGSWKSAHDLRIQTVLLLCIIYVFHTASACYLVQQAAESTGCCYPGLPAFAQDAPSQPLHLWANVLPERNPVINDAAYLNTYVRTYSLE